jgi:starch synthase
MAAARPVVATDVGGIPDAVAHGETGFLVKPADPTALAAAIARLVEDPALRAQFGGAGRERARADYRADAVIDALSALYLTVASRRR